MAVVRGYGCDRSAPSYSRLPLSFCSSQASWGKRRSSRQRSAHPRARHAALGLRHAILGSRLTAGCLIAGLLAADLLRDHPTDMRLDLLLGGAVGLTAGWAVVTEFPAAIPA